MSVINGTKHQFIIIIQMAVEQVLSRYERKKSDSTYPIMVLRDPTYKVSVGLPSPKKVLAMAWDSCGSPAGVPYQKMVELALVASRGTQFS